MDIKTMKEFDKDQMKNEKEKDLYDQSLDSLSATLEIYKRAVIKDADNAKSALRWGAENAVEDIVDMFEGRDQKKLMRHMINIIKFELKFTHKDCDNEMIKTARNHLKLAKEAMMLA